MAVIQLERNGALSGVHAGVRPKTKLTEPTLSETLIELDAGVQSLQFWLNTKARPLISSAAKSALMPLGRGIPDDEGDDDRQTAGQRNINTQGFDIGRAQTHENNSSVLGSVCFKQLHPLPRTGRKTGSVSSCPLPSHVAPAG